MLIKFLIDGLAVSNNNLYEYNIIINFNMYIICIADLQANLIYCIS